MTTKPKCDDCRTKCGTGNLPTEKLIEMEEAFDNLISTESGSMLKKYLTRPIFDMLKVIQTPMGANLLDCIRSGVAHPDSKIGAYACDQDAYVVYQEFFGPVIQQYHSLKKNGKHPICNWGNPAMISNIDPEGKYIISTRIRTGRSIDGIPLTPTMTEANFIEVEQRISLALNSLHGELKGIYYPLRLITKPEQQKLIDDHYLFNDSDKCLKAANIMRHWPKGRGIFYNPQKTFIAWVCEEDHLRIISMQEGGNVRDVYQRLVNAVNELDRLLKFAYNKRLGYITVCPSNLGTAIRASVLIKLKKLGATPDKIENIGQKYNLEIRGTHGEHSEAKDNVYQISNKRRLGLTEFDVVREMCDGINAIIKAEEAA